MKKVLALILVVAMLALGACAPATKGITYGLVTDQGTVTDGSFNQGTYDGMKKLAEEVGEDYKYTQPANTETASYLTGMNELISAGAKLIAAPGFMLADAVDQAAKENPKVHFVFVDGFDVGTVRDNVTYVVFNEEEPGFYAGVAAALTSKTGKVGFIGGVKVPAVNKYFHGYIAGVHYANVVFGTKVEIPTEKNGGEFWCNDFNDQPKAVAATQVMYDKGIDVVFAAAGGSGLGAFTKAKELAVGKTEIPMYVIGCDVDQYSYGDNAGKNNITLGSALKKVDVATYDACKDFSAGTLKGGYLSLSTAEDSQGFISNQLSADNAAKLTSLVKDVAAKKVLIPVVSDYAKNDEWVSYQKITTAEGFKK